MKEKTEDISTVKYIILPKKNPKKPKAQESHPNKTSSSFVSAFHNLQFSL